MKSTALKRWIFAALLLALIAGTIIGHADVARPDQIHRTISADPPAAQLVTMDEIAKQTKKSEDTVVAVSDNAPPLAPVFLPLPLLL